MTVSDKQISIAIITAVFFAGIGYLFFGFGYIEIFINHADIETFQVKSSKKTYQCIKNPCRIKVRANEKFTANVSNSTLKDNEIISVVVPLLKTKKIIIQPKKELPEALVKEIPIDQFLSQRKSREIFTVSDNFGPILTDLNGEFAVFSRKTSTGIKVFIKNNNSEQFLTEINDDFREIFLEKNFTLTNNGILIPAKNRLYFFDFATQRKKNLLEINSLRIKEASVSKKGENAVFYNLKEKAWQIYSTKTRKYKDYSGNIFFVGFWGDNELKIVNNILYLNGKSWQKIPFKIFKSDQFFIKGNILFIRQDFNVLEIQLDK
jgi:hypothetical protein